MEGAAQSSALLGAPVRACGVLSRAAACDVEAQPTGLPRLFGGVRAEDVESVREFLLDYGDEASHIWSLRRSSCCEAWWQRPALGISFIFCSIFSGVVGFFVWIALLIVLLSRQDILKETFYVVSVKQLVLYRIVRRFKPGEMCCPPADWLFCGRISLKDVACVTLVTQRCFDPISRVELSTRDPFLMGEVDVYRVVLPKKEAVESFAILDHLVEYAKLQAEAATGRNAILQHHALHQFPQHDQHAQKNFLDGSRLLYVDLNGRGVARNLYRESSTGAADLDLYAGASAPAPTATVSFPRLDKRS